MSRVILVGSQTVIFNRLASRLATAGHTVLSAQPDFYAVRPMEKLEQVLENHIARSTRYMPDERVTVIVLGTERDVLSMMPLGFAGHGVADIRAVMECTVRASKGRKAPVDMVMLTSFRPSFIHNYVQKLPLRSVVVGIKESASLNGNLQLANELKFRPGHMLRARDVLCQLMTSSFNASSRVSEMIHLWPEVAVSGSGQQSIPDLVKMFSARLKAKALPQQTRDKVMDHLRPYFDPTPLLDLHPANSLMDEQVFKLQMAAVSLVAEWSSCYRCFPPSGKYVIPAPVAQPTPPPVAKPASKPASPQPVLPANANTASSAPTSHRPSRTTTTRDIARGYKPGVPITKQPGVIRGLLKGKLG